MRTPAQTARIAVIGAGIAGAACASRLQTAGYRVQVFDKSRGVGGRMATRRAAWTDADGKAQRSEFDHGAQRFSVTSPAFAAVIAGARAAGCVAPWVPRVPEGHVPASERFVATPHMPALCQHLLAGLSVHLQCQVTGLQRGVEGWQLRCALPSTGEALQGPFDAVLLALPPAQAAALLSPLGPASSGLADGLADWPTAPCWTLMAVADSMALPWDVLEPASGPLAWVARNDSKPGRAVAEGCNAWVAQARTDWSLAHLEADAAEVTTLLQHALQSLLAPRSVAPRWHHTQVHRWRYALRGASAPAGLGWRWDAAAGLGVCGDHLAGPGVGDAWASGHELAGQFMATGMAQS